MVIKKYTDQVYGYDFIQNLSSVLRRSTLKWKDMSHECLPLESVVFVDLENLQIKVYLLTINNNGICK